MRESCENRHKSGLVAAHFSIRTRQVAHHCLQLEFRGAVSVSDGELVDAAVLYGDVTVVCRMTVWPTGAPKMAVPLESVVIFWPVETA
jgi:hypothetical protein